MRKYGVSFWGVEPGGRHVPLTRENRVVRSRTCRGGSNEEALAVSRNTGIKQSAVLHPKAALHTTFTGAAAFSGREGSPRTP